MESYTVEKPDGTIEYSKGSTDTRNPIITVTEDEPKRIVRVKVRENSNLVADCDNGTITWPETESHKYTYKDAQGYTHDRTCSHTITYKATLSVDPVTIHGNDFDNFPPEDMGNVNTFHSVYGFNFWKDGWYLYSGSETDHLNAKITVDIIKETHNKASCPSVNKYTNAHRASTKASSIRLPSVKADVGYTTTGFDSFIDVTQPQIIDFEVENNGSSSVSSGTTVYQIKFSAAIPRSNLVDESKVDSTFVRRIYTPVSLRDGQHTITVQFNGGGLSGTGFCKNYVYTYNIRGSMYDNDHTEANYDIPDFVEW